MSAARRWWLLAGAWMLCASASAAAVPDLIDDCAARSAPATGLVALEAACPGLEQALRDSGLAEFLPRDWPQWLDTAALRDLATLRQRYAQDPPPPPQRGDLNTILEQLASEQVETSRSWWEIAREWLRRWLAGQDPASGSWLDRLFERLAQSRQLITAITYVLLGIIVVAAVAFVVNELRVAGVLTRRGLHDTGGARSAPAGRERVPGLADLDAAPLREQPALLLRMLVAHLMARGALSSERALTHRELVDRATLADAASHERFARVTVLAERTVYGSQNVDEEQARAIVSDGRTLLAQWQASGSGAR